MKKAIIFLLVLLVGGCYLWYRQGEEAQKAETLIWAAYDGDLTGVKNALEDGAPLNWLMYISDPARHYQSAQFTPLLAAASGGNKKVLLYLIKQGQNPSQANIQGWTPLFIAVRDGHAESAAQLVYAGANPNIQTDAGATALILAMVADFPTEKERLSLIEYLLKRGADPNLQTIMGTDALFYAVTELKDPATVQLLLDFKADPCRRYGDETLLELADANEQSAAIISALKKAGKSCSKKI